MLNLLEKITAGFCGFVVLCVGVMYAWLGTGSPTPIEFVRKVKFVDSPEPPKTPKAGGAQGAPAKNASNFDQGAIAAKLKKQGVRVRGAVKPKTALVPSDTFEYVQHEAHWMKELKKYKSRIVHGPDRRGTRLRITDGIQDDTILGKMGFQNGDTLELIDGQIIEYSEQSTLRYRSMAHDAIERLRRGEGVSVTITRDGQPLNIEFRLTQ